MIVMTGEELSQNIKTELKQLIKGYMIKPCLAVVQIGENAVSESYTSSRTKMSEEVGIYLKHIRFSDDAKEIEIINKIIELNNDDYVNGILLQMPIPEKYNRERLINYIARNKDIEGLTDLNLGKLFNNKKTYIPSAPQAVLALCDFYNISFEGQHVVIINRSASVGKPLAGLLLNRDATVTVCHSKTVNLKELTKKADILITAVGQKDFITKEMIKENAIIMDIGLTEVDGKLYGDVCMEDIEKKVSYVTSTSDMEKVTIAMLLKNVVDSYQKMNEDK